MIRVSSSASRAHRTPPAFAFFYCACAADKRRPALEACCGEAGLPAERKELEARRAAGAGRLLSQGAHPLFSHDSSRAPTSHEPHHSSPPAQAPAQAQTKKKTWAAEEEDAAGAAPVHVANASRVSSVGSSWLLPLLACSLTVGLSLCGPPTTFASDDGDGAGPAGEEADWEDEPVRLCA